VVLFDEAKERRVLIGDPRHRDAFVDGAGEQRREVVPRHLTIGRRNRIAVGVHLGPAQHFIDPFDEPIRDDVLQLLGFVVHLVPPESHHSNQEELHQPVTTEDECGQLLSGGTEPDAVVWLVLDQPRFRERLHHRGGRPRRHLERGRELPHGYKPLPRRQLALTKVNRFQVVLDGAGRKHRGIISLPDFGSAGLTFCLLS